VPNSTLHKLYDAAWTFGLHAAATSLYASCRSIRVHNQHVYPPPRHSPLSWLLHHLTHEVKNMYLARQLVEQVFHTAAPIAPSSRATFIAHAAEQGFALAARGLWERYAGGRFGSLVTASGTLLVRMVSLYASLARRERRLIRINIPKDGEAVELSHDARRPYFVKRRARHDEYVKFARRVLNTFREAKGPLESASREDLNALARAHFLLHDLNEGFDVLALITKRAEVPDMRDINVALGAVAFENPSVALRMVERMTVRRRRPDNVTVGTIIHQALRKRLLDVAEDALQFAAQHNIPLDLKTVESIIRVSLDISQDDSEVTTDNLRRALHILRENEALSYLARAPLGELCATAAAAAGDAALAYDFWHEMVRRKADWKDAERGEVRKRIMRAVWR
ncbi:hypothetical protein K488DRAFT_23869, partial [Vararia minispora EC-137]